MGIVCTAPLQQYLTVISFTISSPGLQTWLAPESRRSGGKLQRYSMDCRAKQSNQPGNTNSSFGSCDWNTESWGKRLPPEFNPGWDSSPRGRVILTFHLLTGAILQWGFARRSALPQLPFKKSKVIRMANLPNLPELYRAKPLLLRKQANFFLMVSTLPCSIPHLVENLEEQPFQLTKNKGVKPRQSPCDNRKCSTLNLK